MASSGSSSGFFLVPGLLQVDVSEGVLVHDQHPLRLQLGQVDLQSGRIHRHECVRGVAGGVDRDTGEADLKGGNAGKRACRGADLGRVVRKGADVVPEQGRRGRELRAGELHAVPGVPAEQDGHAIEFLFLHGGFGHEILNLLLGCRACCLGQGAG